MAGVGLSGMLGALALSGALLMALAQQRVQVAVSFSQGDLLFMPIEWVALCAPAHGLSIYSQAHVCALHVNQSLADDRRR